MVRLFIAIMCIGLICAQVASATDELANAGQFTWTELPSLPDTLGVAGPFVGVHNDALIIAGGANFPHPVWENDKVWHDRIHVLVRHGEELVWKDGGRLPQPIAYGMSVSVPCGVVCMGGNDVSGTFDNVFLLQWDVSAGKVTATDYPPLPKACAHGAAVSIGDVIYLAGGQSGLSLDTAMANFWSLDLSKQNSTAEFVWKERQPWPGPSRAFNITAHQHNGNTDCVYVISGRRQEEDSLGFLRDVWQYTPSQDQWRRRQDTPRCLMAGTGIGSGQNRISIFGGAEETLYFRADELKDEHPGFIKEALTYNTITDAWTSAGATPSNHVTTIAVKWKGSIIIPSGEIRPRVRSPKVWSIQPVVHNADATAVK